MKGRKDWDAYDLSRLTQRQARLRDAVIRLGRTAYGERWQTDLAAALSSEAGRRISQSQLSHWIQGTRPVPESLAEPLRRTTLALSADLRRRSDELAGLRFPRAPFPCRPPRTEGATPPSPG